MSYMKDLDIRLMNLTEEFTRAHPDIPADAVEAAIRAGATAVLTMDDAKYFTPRALDKIARDVGLVPPLVDLGQGDSRRKTDDGESWQSGENQEPIL